MHRALLTVLCALALGGCSLVYDSGEYREPLVDGGAAQADARPAPVCGNDVCEPGESHGSCKDDCDKPDDDDDDD